MNDLKTCTGDSSDKFNSWLLSVEIVSKLIGSDHKIFFFAKADEGNLLKFLYSIQLEVIIELPKEKMRA